jgi:hypothetical protein
LCGWTSVLSECEEVAFSGSLVEWGVWYTKTPGARCDSPSLIVIRPR